LSRKADEFEDDFFTVLEKVQATTELFPQDMEIRDECGIARSLWHSVTSHARNMDIPIELIKAINRWRSEATSVTNAPRLDMPDVYSSLASIIPTTLCFLLGL
jgi:hypothetical protein